MYRFDFASDVEDGALGAPHAMDVAFTFGNADAAALSGSRPERHDLARLTSAAWAAFARHGSPVTPELQTWASYEPERRTTMLLDVRCRSVEDPDAAEREAWDGIEIS
ncbi:MAG: carboxylesterase family protein [Acidimicrobiales bacterium]